MTPSGLTFSKEIGCPYLYSYSYSTVSNINSLSSLNTSPLDFPHLV